MPWSAVWDAPKPAQGTQAKPGPSRGARPLALLNPPILPTTMASYPFSCAYSPVGPRPVIEARIRPGFSLDSVS